jgi:hypothetical protein
MSDIIIPHFDEYLREVFYDFEDNTIKELIPIDLLEKLYHNGKIGFTKLNLLEKIFCLQLLGKRLGIMAFGKDGDDLHYRVAEALNVGNSENDITALNRLEQAGAFVIVGSNIMYSVEYNAMLLQSNKYSLIRDFRKCTSAKFTNINQVDNNALEFLKTVEYYNSMFGTIYDVAMAQSRINNMDYDSFMMLTTLYQSGHIREVEFCKKMASIVRQGVNNMQKKLKVLESTGYVSYNRKTNKDVKVYLSQKGSDYIKKIYLEFNKKFKNR